MILPPIKALPIHRNEQTKRSEHDGSFYTKKFSSKDKTLRLEYTFSKQSQRCETFDQSDEETQSDETKDKYK